MGNVDVPFTRIAAEDKRLAEVAAQHSEAGPVLVEPSDSAIDVRAVWSTVYRYRYIMLAIIVGALLLGVISTLLMPRIYEARASLQIEQQSAKVLGTEDAPPVANGEDADRFIQTQADVLTSRGMSKRVADNLGLAANDEFLNRMAGGKQATVAKGAGSRLDRVLDALQLNMKIDLRRNSGVVGILFRSRDPQLAAEIANSYSSSFIESTIQRKFATSAYSRKFLSEQLGLAKGRLENSERALIDYARSARLIDASAGATRQASVAEGPRSLVTANLVDVNTAYAESDANLARARQRWEQAQATPLMSLPEVLSNDAIQRLTQKRAEDVASLDELRKRLKADHPSVVQAVAEISSLDQQIATMAQSVRGSIKNQYLTAERQQGALGGKVASLKDATLAEQVRSVRYNILQREVDTNRQLYESLLNRFKQVSAESGVTTNNVAVIDTAEAPRRAVSPRRMLNLAISLIAGIGFALLYAFGRDYLDDSIRDPQDVESKLHLPLLGVVPEDASGSPLTSLIDPKSDIAEAYSSIRTSIELSSNQGLPRSVLVTGGGKSEGKSTTSFALAHGFATSSKRVLLVDADLRRPSIHRLIEKKGLKAGLSTVLAKRDPVMSAIISSETPNLFVLPCGILPPDPATLFAGSALNDLLAELREQYDIIVIDGPPVLALADAAQLSAAAQATIFVVEAGGAHFGQARNAVSRLTRANANIIGCVVTKYNARKQGYAQAYDYYRYSYKDGRERG